MDDVWLHVFSFLSSGQLLTCEKVCRRWEHLVAETFSKRVVLDIQKEFPSSMADPREMASIIDRHGLALRQVEIRAKAKTERHEICASEYHVTRHVMQSLTQRARRLRELRLERMILTLAAIEQLPLLPDTLEVLVLKNCNLSCNSPAVNELIQLNLKKFLEKCSQLKTFEISGRGYSLEHFKINSDLLEALPTSLRHLSISAGRSLKITDLNFLDGRRLQSLNLERSFISTTHLEQLASMASSLTVLDISQSINILDCSPLGKLHQLRELSANGLREGMDDRSLVDIIRGCSSLEKLSMENCARLTDRSLVLLGTLRKLQWLCISGITDVTDQVVMEISSCSYLRYLNINFCRKVTESSISVILALPCMRHFEFLGSVSFSSSDMQHVDSCTVVCDQVRPSLVPFPLVLPPLPPPNAPLAA